MQHLFLAAGSLGTTKLLLDARRRRTLHGLGDDVGQRWGNNGDELALRVGVGPTGLVSGGPSPWIVPFDDNPVGPSSIDVASGGLGEECLCITVLGMGIPRPRGELSLDGVTGELQLEWPAGATTGSSAAIQAIHDRLNAANPGSVNIPLPNLRPTTFHPLGGAVMGRVCDTFGRVRHNRNLFVVDGALIPGSTAARNPALTITALAERAMDRLLDDEVR